MRYVGGWRLAALGAGYWILAAGGGAWSVERGGSWFVVMESTLKRVLYLTHTYNSMLLKCQILPNLAKQIALEIYRGTLCD